MVRVNGDIGLAVRDLGAPPSPETLVPVPAVPTWWTATWAESVQAQFRRLGLPADQAKLHVDAGRKAIRPANKSTQEGAAVTTRVVLNTTGRLTQPVLLPPQPSPAHVASALISLETWRSPLLGDEPVEARASISFPGFVAPTISASGPPALPLGPRAVEAREAELLALLQAGAGAEALAKAAVLVADHVERSFGAKDAAEKLARALALRGRAAELTGDQRLGAWSWAAAEQLHRESANQIRRKLGLPPEEPAADVEAAVDVAATASMLPVTSDPAAIVAAIHLPGSRPASNSRKGNKNAVRKIHPGMEPPVLLTKAEPNYPMTARERRANGEVVLQAVIDSEGYVTQPVILQSAEPDLTVAALEAVRHWRYQPARLNGVPQAVYLIIRSRFNL